MSFSMLVGKFGNQVGGSWITLEITQRYIGLVRFDNSLKLYLTVIYYGLPCSGTEKLDIFK